MLPDSPHLLSLFGMPAVVHSRQMRSLFDNVRRLAQSEAIVLITGESGTGKELVARALHQFSPRSRGPWVDLSCTTLPEHLGESELFGYEKGAFSGALASKPGLFEMASQGTLFLDEIGDLPASMQAKLLRILDGADYYRLGGTRKIRMQARIVAATHRDLEAEVRAGRFREDLFHRLDQLIIRVPSLRERSEDIAPLAEFFLSQARPGFRFSDQAIAALESYSWPGNVRQLRNVVIRSAMLADQSPVDRCSLAALAAQTGEQPCNLESAEKVLILQALERCAGHRQRTAGMLGISRRTLSRKLKQYSAAL
jgi:DNA-binding NtrC family response regulator